MTLFQNLFRFIVFSNLFIAACATMMSWETFTLLEVPADTETLLFIFSATLCSYSFHWMLTTEWLQDTPRARWQKANPRIHAALLVPSAIASMWFALQLIQYWPYLLLVACLTFLYSAPKIPHPFFTSLRRIAVAKTLFLTSVWAMATTLIPWVVAQKPLSITVLFYFLQRFLLIYAICILFDLRDREYDRQHGIRSLITWLNPGQIRRLFLFVLFSFLIAMVGLALSGTSVVFDIVLLIPGITTGILYTQAVNKPTDYLFYFGLDGLMALSAALNWVLHLMFLC